MSASLVGSEMCIRDRTTTWPNMMKRHCPAQGTQTIAEQTQQTHEGTTAETKVRTTSDRLDDRPDPPTERSTCVRAPSKHWGNAELCN
eukprot:14494470-Alexandrium_andersonii.AAC.1